MRRFPIAAVAALLARGANSYVRQVDWVESPFDLVTPDAAIESCGLAKETARALEGIRYDKVACPFGVLVACSAAYPTSTCGLAANVIATLLDANQDGVPDAPAVAAALALGSDTAAALVCGTSRAEERKAEDLPRIDYSFGSQSYDRWDPTNVILEESFHLVHQNGWAMIWPEVFGYASDFSSTVCAETARLQCVSPGWVHPENKCPDGDEERAPGDPAPSPVRGGCNKPKCDCNEFHWKAVEAYMYQPDAFYWHWSDSWPRNRADVMAMLSDSYKAVLEDPTYGLPQKPIMGEYCVGCQPVASTYQPTYQPTSGSRNPTKQPVASTKTPTPQPAADLSPTKSPTKSTKSPTKQPVAPGPAPGPAPFPGCEDDDSWHKKRDSNKKCSWIGSNKNRCVVKGDDERWGFEACRETCGTCLEKEACPSDGDAKSEWMHASGDDFKNCAWVAEFSGNRCAQPGMDGSFAFQGCPVACRTCGYDCGVDDENWHKESEPEKTCDWVAAATGVRCDTPGEDDVLAYRACPSACRACAGAFSDCKDDDDWHKNRNPSKTCEWIASVSDRKMRCLAKGEEADYAFLSCPVTCDTC